MRVCVNVLNQGLQTGSLAVNLALRDALSWWCCVHFSAGPYFLTPWIFTIYNAGHEGVRVWDLWVKPLSALHFQRSIRVCTAPAKSKNKSVALNRLLQCYSIRHRNKIREYRYRRNRKKMDTLGGKYCFGLESNENFFVESFDLLFKNCFLS